MSPAELIRQVLQSAAMHPLRTAMAASSVAWGIFLLVLLLGLGTGLRNAVVHQFAGDAVNSLWVWQGRTTMPHAGYGVGRVPQMTNADLDALGELIPALRYRSGRVWMRGVTVMRDGATGPFEPRAVHPDYRHVELTEVVSGRWMNPTDITERRKVAIIGEEVARELYKDEDPLGTTLQIGGLPFQVVGVFKDAGGAGEMRRVYLPITTAQAVFLSGDDSIRAMAFALPDMSVESSQQIETELREALAERLGFNPRDRGAVRIRNNLIRFEQFTRIVRWLETFVQLAGIGTVLAGAVGVGNILLVSVAERTPEIGLRKALGATPANLMAGVILEALLLTCAAGYGGIVVGVASLELIGRVVPDNPWLRHPEVSFPAVIGASALLVVVGVAAGLWPAWRASRIHPVVALRDAA